MTQRYCLPVLICLFLIQATQAQVENPRDATEEIRFDVIANNQLERNKFGLAGRVNQELARFRLFAKTSTKTAEKLQRELQPWIKKSNSSRTPISTKEILLATADAAKKHTTNPNLLEDYLADLEDRLAFDKTITQQTDVYFVDCFVGLNDQQWESTREVSSELYRQDLGSLQTLILSDPELASPELEQFRESLSEAQIKYLRTFIPEWKGDFTPQALNAPFRLVAEMKLQQLASIVELSQRQRTKLKFVAQSTVVPNAVERRIKVKEDFRKFALALAKQGPPLTNDEVFDTMNLADQRAPFFFPDERWQKFVSSTLNEKQAEKWQRFTVRRQAAAIDAQAFAVRNFCTSQLPLTSDQQIAAHKLICRSVRARGAKLEDSFVELFFNPNILPRVVTQREFISAIGIDNWAKLDDVCKQSLPLKKAEVNGGEK